MKGRVLAVAGLAVALLAAALPAKGCSCADERDLREELRKADGAMVATFLESRSEDGDQRLVHTMRVDEAVKGDLGETVEVHTSGDGAMCGFGGSPGQQIALFLRRNAEGAWSAGSCSIVDAGELREAAAALPEPDGRGTARLLAGGSWGEVSYVALDGRARTLAYDTRDEQIMRLAACPGAGAFFELHRSGAGYGLSLRRVETNEVVWASELGSDPFEGRVPWELACARKRRPVAYVATQGYGESRGQIFRFGAFERHDLYDGELYGAAFSGRMAYLQRGTDGREVVEHKLGIGTERVIGHTYGEPTDLVVSPDGRRLATFARDTVFVFDIATGERVGRETGYDRHSSVAWFDDDRLGLFPHCSRRGVRVFDAGLRPRGRLEGGWCADVSDNGDLVTSGGAVFGLFYGTLRRAVLGDRLRVVRKFPSGHIRVLTPLPDPHHIEWPAP